MARKRREAEPQFRTGWYVHELGGKHYVFLDGRNIRGPYATPQEAEEQIEKAQASREKLRREASRERPASPPMPAHERAIRALADGRDFPDGTVLIADYKGARHHLTVRMEGPRPSYELGGERYRSPSAAGKAVTGTSVNGWRFWRQEA